MVDFDKYKIILASQSPRRKLLLEGMGFKFEVIHADIEEVFPENLKITEVPVYLAQKKAESLTNLLKDNVLLITADTIVSVDNLILGKPKDADEARHILQLISGRSHNVITGVCIKTLNKERTFYAESKVYFRTLTDEEISYYIWNYKPFDKAGAYGIQEWIGYIGIERIEGSYFNVMGLPTQMLYNEISKF
jgi:septum formation protein